MAKAAEKKGVRYVTGDAGQIKQLYYDQDGTCKGAIAANGHLHRADLVVVAAGASLPALIDAASDVVAQTSAICVIKLEPDEIEKYRDIPIIDDFEQGRFL